MKKNALIIFGGVSSEHDISLISAKSVIDNIPKDKYDVTPVGITKEGEWFLYDGETEKMPGDKWINPDLERAALLPGTGGTLVIYGSGKTKTKKIDVCFPVLHGRNGEDGAIQGYLDICGVPCVGCDLLSSAMCMDKSVTNSIMDISGVKQAKWLSCDIDTYLKEPAKFIDRCSEYLGFPIFVKPANAGSSVGITKVKTREDMEPALRKAFEEDSKAVCEETITGHEVETAVLGNSDPEVSCVGEIRPSNEFYDFKAKYEDDSGLDIPAHLPEEITDKIRSAAVRAYKALGCSGMARCDFFAKDNGEVYLNELNTIPGFTSISMYPKLWEESGLKFPDLLDRLMVLAQEKYKEKKYR